MAANQHSENDKTAAQPDVRLLWLGLIVGAALAGFGMLERETTIADEGVAAIVNDALITDEQYQRALARQQADSVDPLSAEDRQWVLDRLIDEELLIQRATALGMVESESEVRSAMVRSLIASVTAEADAANPSDDELQSWFDDNAERFTYASAMAVKAWTSSDQASAQAFAAALRNSVEENPPAGVRPLPGLPDGMMPVTKLRDYLGPGIAGALERLPEGLVAVYTRQGSWLVVQIVAKQQSQVADITDIRAQVLAEYRRDLADQSLRDYLDALRSRASVAVSE